MLGRWDKKPRRNMSSKIRVSRRLPLLCLLIDLFLVRFTWNKETTKLRSTYSPGAGLCVSKRFSLKLSEKFKSYACATIMQICCNLRWSLGQKNRHVTHNEHAMCGYPLKKFQLIVFYMLQESYYESCKWNSRVFLFQ